MSAALAIEVRGLNKVFGSGSLAFHVLKEVNFEVATGELVMLKGPSGSGKTTLLSIMGCVLRATSGSVKLLGRETVSLRESDLPAFRAALIGFIFQGHNLLASLTALENVSMVQRLRGVPAGAAEKEARRLLDRVGLGDKLRNLPTQLSGGQRQRVAIARALAGSPPLVFADEPTAALDAKSGLEVTELLVELCRERGTSVVVVTHDDRIYHLADRIVAIEDGEILRDLVPVPPRPGSSSGTTVGPTPQHHAPTNEAQP